MTQQATVTRKRIHELWIRFSDLTDSEILHPAATGKTPITQGFKDLVGLSAHEQKHLRPLLAHSAQIREGRATDLLESVEYKPTGRARQRQTRLRPDQIDQLVTDYQAGETLRGLACRYDCHRTTVSSILQVRGVPVRSTSLTKAQVQRAARLYATGLSLVDVGKPIGANAETIRQRFIELGIPRRDAHARG